LARESGALTPAKLDISLSRSLILVLMDVVYLARNWKWVLKASRGSIIPHAFRERLMLAAISVYGCRYCTWAHTGAALRHGVGREEIAGLLAGSVEGCLDEELVALIYAQHWADTGARPEVEAVSRLEQEYGAERAATIDAILHMIRIGNLWGNSWDHLVHCVSCGRFGK